MTFFLTISSCGRLTAPLNSHVMRLKTIPVFPAQEVEITSDIQSVQFKAGELAVVIAKTLLPSEKVAGVLVTFTGVQGFRFLDEADLSRYWSESGFIHGFHVLQVQEGGWATEENDLAGYSFNRREWLIVTGNGCLSVFAQGPPSYEETEIEFDA